MSYFRDIGIRSLARELTALAKTKDCELQRDKGGGWKVIRAGAVVVPFGDLRAAKKYLEEL